MTLAVWTDEALDEYAQELAYMRDKLKVVDAYLTAVSRLREAQARVRELERLVSAAEK